MCRNDAVREVQEVLHNRAARRGKFGDLLVRVQYDTITESPYSEHFKD